MAWAAADDEGGARLLAAHEPPPHRVLNSTGRGSFLLLADHAGALIPACLRELGLSPGDRARHIALDLGVAELGEALAARLDAPLVAQRYSRLVIDCNRDPSRPDAIPGDSDGSAVPGNRDLGPAERRLRVAAIHDPYHRAIAAELARRDAAGGETVVIALHSFTPALAAAAAGPRPWHAGVLYGGGNDSYAHAVLRALRQRLAVPVGDNEPYAMDGTDFTIPHHCFAAGRRYVELEVRQDLLTAPGGPERWADLLAEVLPAAL